MKKLFLGLCLIINLAVFARTNKFSRFNGNNDSLRIINKPALDSLLKSTTDKMTLLIIYTNYCPGTKYILNNAKMYLEKYRNGLEIILASSAPYKDIKQLRKVLNKFAIALPTTYIIDSDLYKDYRLDDRKKGYNFRNDICKECRSDIIGVPYSILYSRSKDVLFHGYSSDINFDSLLYYYIHP